MLDGLVAAVVVDVVIETPGVPAGGRFCGYPAAADDDDETAYAGVEEGDVGEDDAPAPAVGSGSIPPPLDPFAVSPAPRAAAAAAAAAAAGPASPAPSPPRGDDDDDALAMGGASLLLLFTDGEPPALRSGWALLAPTPPLWADADVEDDEDEDDEGGGGGGDDDSMSVLSIFMILYCVAALLHATR
jgi:hypothetical protein